MLTHALTAAAVLGFWYLCGVLAYHVPKYEAMFKSLNARLPQATVLTLQASAFVQAHWLIILLFGTIGIVGVCLIVRGVNNTLGAITSALACVVMGLGIWGCYASINLVIRELQRQLS